MYQVFALEMVGGQGRGRLSRSGHIHSSIHLFMPHVRMQCMHFALRLHDTHVHSRLYVAGQVDCSLDSSDCCVMGCGKGGNQGADPVSEVCITVLCICARCSVAGTDGVLGTCCVKVFGQGGVGDALTE
jgi:hypothetical protein